MKILLACSKYMPEYSGAGFRAHNLYKRLLAGNPDLILDIVCGSETENDCRKYEHDGFTVSRIACKQYLQLDSGITRRWQNLCNFHSENSEASSYLAKMPAKPDLIHVFGQNYLTVSVIDYAIKNRIPLLVELVTDLESPFYYVPFPFKYWISTRPLERFKFVCISEKLKAACVRHGIHDADIWCRPNPIDEKRFKPVSQAEKISLRGKLTRFAAEDKVVSYIAKFRPSKNQKFLVEAMKILPDNFKLLLKGPLVKEGPLAERDNLFFNETKKLASSLGLDDRIQIEEGFCQDVQEYYQMSDAYAFPSTMEGLGTPLLESIACGVPVAANRIPGVTDTWIKVGETGYLSGLDPAEFAKSMEACTRLPKEKLAAGAAYISRTAGTGCLDREYLSIIKSLTGN